MSFIQTYDENFVTLGFADSHFSNWKTTDQKIEEGLIFLANQETSKDFYWDDDQNKFFMTHAFVCRLDNDFSKLLNLPEIIPYTLRINKTSSLGADNCRFKTIFLNKNKPIRIDERIGSFVTIGKFTFRLPEVFYEVIKIIRAHGNNHINTLDNNFATASEIKTLLNIKDTHFILDDEIAQLNLHHASAISVNVIKNEDNKLSVKPVLFNKNQLIQNEKGELLNDFEQILPGDNLKDFQNQFSNNNNFKTTYLANDGSYIFLDKSVSDAAQVVHELCRTSSNHIKEFLNNPKLYISQKIEEKYEGNFSNIDQKILIDKIDTLSSSFIVTNQLSERVIGEGIWKAPSLPFIKKIEIEWNDNKVFVVVDNKTLSFWPKEIPEVIKKIETSLKNDEDELEINNVSISKNSLSTLKKTLEDYEIVTPDPDPNPDPDPKPDPKTKVVMLTKENFFEMQFIQSLVERKKDRISNLNNHSLAKDFTLKKHQEIGLKWLVDSYNKGFPGVLLADDMGLGKTIQALVFLSLVLNDNEIRKYGPTMIVAPVGLLKNWIEEQEKFLSSPGLGVLARLYGHHVNEYRIKNRNGLYQLDVNELKNKDCLLISYESLEKYHQSICKIPFSCIVFDEVQKIKNPKALVTSAAKSINGKFKVALTGTPVENSVVDLWTIIDSICPGRLEPLKQFVKNYPENNETKLKSLADSLTKSGSSHPPMIMRRLKSTLNIENFPKKILRPIEETTLLMPEVQNYAYLDVTNKLNRKELKKIEAIQDWRIISLHPHVDMIDQFSDDQIISNSARMQVTFNILDEIYRKKEKVLVFIERKKLQTKFASIVKAKYSLEKIPMIINGDIQSDARQKIINKFQSEENIFDLLILSPKAGGVGITLTAANHVIHLERWWNPAVEDQCTDRAYRIGQKKDVYVYTPIAQCVQNKTYSFDLILNTIMENKRNLSKATIIPTLIKNSDFEWAFRNNNTTTSLDEIDALEPLGFEEYVESELSFNYIVKKTPYSSDGGADLIVYNHLKEPLAIVQCKHTGNNKPIDRSSIDDLIRATKNYEFLNFKNLMLLIISNAKTRTKIFNSRVKELSNMRVINGENVLNLKHIAI